MNQMFIVGRLVADPVANNEATNKATQITLAVPRSYKNVEGVYETDFIPVMLYNNMATNTCEFTRKGDLIGIKGRLETITNSDNSQKLVVVADRVTFLSSNSHPTKDNPNPQTDLNEGEI